MTLHARNLSSCLAVACSVRGHGARARCSTARNGARSSRRAACIADRRPWKAKPAPQPPRVSRSRTYLEQLHGGCADCATARSRPTSPSSAKADPSWFGICLATTDGQRLRGRRLAPAVHDPVDLEAVRLRPRARGPRARRRCCAKVGVEPTGDAFNSISLDPATGRPLNPMINAGAIADDVARRGPLAGGQAARASSRCSRSTPAARSTIDEAVYRSEKRDRASQPRHRPHAAQLRHPDRAIPTPRSISTSSSARSWSTCRDLARDGRDARQRRRQSASPASARSAPSTSTSVLSVMTTCGMYDYAGEWIYAVGMPAKSGVAGGILAVLPGQLGIGVFSPPLDARGNSVRGVAVCTRAVARLQPALPARAARRRARSSAPPTTLATVRSRRSRSAGRARRARRAPASARRVYELQGDLAFAAVERVVRQIVDAAEGTDYTVLDLQHVARSVRRPARLLLALLLELGRARQAHRAVVAPRDTRASCASWRRSSTASARERPAAASPTSTGRSSGARTGCSTRKRGDERRGDPLADHPLCRGLDAEAIAALEKMLEQRSFARGSLLVSRGEPADATSTSCCAARSASA